MDLQDHNGQVTVLFTLSFSADHLGDHLRLSSNIQMRAIYPNSAYVVSKIYREPPNHGASLLKTGEAKTAATRSSVWGVFHMEGVCMKFVSCALTYVYLFLVKQGICGINYYVEPDLL